MSASFSPILGRLGDFRGMLVQWSPYTLFDASTTLYRRGPSTAEDPLGRRDVAARFGTVVSLPEFATLLLPLNAIQGWKAETGPRVSDFGYRC